MKMICNRAWCNGCAGSVCPLSRPHAREPMCNGGKMCLTICERIKCVKYRIGKWMGDK